MYNTPVGRTFLLSGRTIPSESCHCVAVSSLTRQHDRNLAVINYGYKRIQKRRALRPTASGQLLTANPSTSRVSLFPSRIQY